MRFSSIFPQRIGLVGHLGLWLCTVGFLAPASVCADADLPTRRGSLRCVEGFKNLFLAKNNETSRLEYNRVIELPLSDFEYSDLKPLMHKLINIRGSLNKDVPVSEFHGWMTKRFPDEAAFRKMQQDKVTVGKWLHEEFLRFFAVRPNPGRDQIKKATAEISKFPGKALQACAKSAPAKMQACLDKEAEKIPGLVSRVFQKTCIGRNPRAQQNLVRNLVLTMSGLGIYQATENEDPTWGNFPYEYLASGLTFSSVLGEIGCRKLLAGDWEVGVPIPPTSESGWGPNLKHRGGKVGAYLKWIPALTLLETGYIVAGQRLRGDESSPKDAAVLWGFFTGYSSLFSTPINALVVDPFFLRIFPKFEPVIDKLVRNKVVATVAKLGINYAARAGVRYGNYYTYFEAQEMYYNALGEPSPHSKLEKRNHTGGAAVNAHTYNPEEVDLLLQRMADVSVLPFSDLSIDESGDPHH